MKQRNQYWWWHANALRGLWCHYCIVIVYSRPRLVGAFCLPS